MASYEQLIQKLADHKLQQAERYDYLKKLSTHIPPFKVYSPSLVYSPTLLYLHIPDSFLLQLFLLQTLSNTGNSSHQFYPFQFSVQSEPKSKCAIINQAQMIVEPEDQPFFQNIIKKFNQFLTSQLQKNERSVYVKQAKETVPQKQQFIFPILFSDLYAFDQFLAENMIAHFQRLEADLNLACLKFYHSVCGELKITDHKVKISIKGMATCNLRLLRSGLLGNLVCFQGTVTLSSQVYPQVKEGVFKCNFCGQNSRPIAQQFKFTKPKSCVREMCDNKESWSLIKQMSVFDDFQRIKVQQNPQEIPPGGMPRSIQVILRGVLTQQAKPGDSIKITGYAVASPDIYSLYRPGEKPQSVKQVLGKRGQTTGITGLKSIGVRDLSYKMVFVANGIQVLNNTLSLNEGCETRDNQQSFKYNPKKQMQLFLRNLTDFQKEQITRISTDPDRYRKMANSLFPDIYGHHQIKKAILLQLFSGVYKQTEEIRLRGDINILVVGDPSTAKSQFLKVTSDFVPRSVYTNGKTSSAAGLTASVTKDINGDYAIQAGALVLADGGICCIDEFDKMDIKDQVAIHEAMQQQTISLSKAGVNATLNTRTSILAAANPKYGRYDKAKSLRKNLQISEPIMSRFDLFFVVTDECREQSDRIMAQFILNKHCGFQFNANLFPKQALKIYIKYARTIQPRFNKQSAALLKQSFKRLRNEYKLNKNTSFMITVRQLESLIRLSQACARMNNDFTIRKEYVQEATRLLKASILRIERQDIQVQDYQVMPVQTLAQQIQIHSKKIQTLSYQSFAEMQRVIYKLFKNQEEIMESDQDKYTAKQSDIVNQLVNFMNSQLSNREQLDAEELQTKQKKIASAVISRLIKKQKLLRVIEDHRDANERRLALHPDYIPQ